MGQTSSDSSSRIGIEADGGAAVQPPVLPEEQEKLAAEESAAISGKIDSQIVRENYWKLSAVLCLGFLASMLVLKRAVGARYPGKQSGIRLETIVRRLRMSPEPFLYVKPKPYPASSPSLITKSQLAEPRAPMEDFRKNSTPRYLVSNGRVIDRQAMTPAASQS